MHPQPYWQDQVIARFLDASRQYLGLTDASPAKQAPAKKNTGNYRYRQVLKSLLMAGSLGALVGTPAFASNTIRRSNDAERPAASASASDSAPSEDAQRPILYSRRR